MVDRLFRESFMRRPALRPADTGTTNARDKNGLTFHPLPNIYDEYSNVAKGYRLQALIRPGDPIVARAPAFDPENQSAKNKPYSLAMTMPGTLYGTAPRADRSGIWITSFQHV